MTSCDLSLANDQVTTHATARRTIEYNYQRLLVLRRRRGRRWPSCRASTSLAGRARRDQAAVMRDPRPGRRPSANCTNPPAEAPAARAGLHRPAAEDPRPVPPQAGRQRTGQGHPDRRTGCAKRSTASSSWASAAAIWGTRHSSRPCATPTTTNAREAAHGQAAHLLRGQQRRQRHPAGTVRAAAEHLRRSRTPRGALGRDRHQQVGRDAGDRGRLSGPCKAEAASSTARSRRHAQAADRPRHRARGASSATCARPRATPTTTSSPSPTTSAGGSACSRRSACCRPRSWASTSAHCCSAPRP